MNENSFIDDLSIVKRHLQELHLALSSKKRIMDILDKKKNESHSDPFTTFNTLLDLGFTVDDVIRELKKLTERDYIETIKDNKHANSTDFYVFGIYINGKPIYIKEKLRGPNNVFCVSFHYAKFPLKQGPYC